MCICFLITESVPIPSLEVTWKRARRSKRTRSCDPPWRSCKPTRPGHPCSSGWCRVDGECGVPRDHPLDRGDGGCYVGLLHQLICGIMWNYWTCWGLLKEFTKWDDPPSRCLGVENLWWTVWWKRGFLPSPSWGFGLVVNFRYGSLGTLK